MSSDAAVDPARRQLAMISAGAVGAIVEDLDLPEHTWCNSACVVASTRRDWIAAVTSNDGAHARWNPVRDAVCTRLIHSPVFR